VKNIDIWQEKEILNELSDVVAKINEEEK